MNAEFHIFALICSMSLLRANYLDKPDFAWANEIVASPNMPEEVRLCLLRLRILTDTSKGIFDHA